MKRFPHSNGFCHTITFQHENLKTSKYERKVPLIPYRKMSQSAKHVKRSVSHRVLPHLPPSSPYLPNAGTWRLTIRWLQIRWKGSLQLTRDHVTTTNLQFFLYSQKTSNGTERFNPSKKFPHSLPKSEPDDRTSAKCQTHAASPGTPYPFKAIYGAVNTWRLLGVRIFFSGNPLAVGSFKSVKTFQFSF